MCTSVLIVRCKMLSTWPRFDCCILSKEKLFLALERKAGFALAGNPVDADLPQHQVFVPDHEELWSEACRCMYRYIFCKHYLIPSYIRLIQIFSMLRALQSSFDPLVDSLAHSIPGERYAEVSTLSSPQRAYKWCTCLDSKFAPLSDTIHSGAL